MSRLYRGMWQVLARYPDRYELHPPAVALTHEAASMLAPMIGEQGALGAILIKVPGSRASWERRALFEASDPPRWGDE